MGWIEERKAFVISKGRKGKRKERKGRRREDWEREMEVNWVMEM